MANLRDSFSPMEIEVALRAFTIVYEVMDTLDVGLLTPLEVEVAARLLEVRRQWEA